MEISTIVEEELISSNVIDNTLVYDYTQYQHFKKSTDEVKTRLQDNGKIYQWVGDFYNTPLYDAADETHYKIGDILYDGVANNMIIVSALDNEQYPVQPDLYAATQDATFTFDTWSTTWSKIQTGMVHGPSFTGFTKVVNTTGNGDVTHELYKDMTSSTNWRYRISWAWETDVWGTELFDINPSVGKVSHVKFNANQIDFVYDAIAPVYTHSSGLPIEYETIVTGTDGSKYRIGKLQYEEVSGPYKGEYYGIQKLEKKLGRDSIRDEATVYMSNLDNNSVIEPAYCTFAHNCPDSWIGKTFVLKPNGDLYVRTGVGVEEMAVVVGVTYTIADTLESMKGLGWVYEMPINKYKPFDNKQYTSIKGAGTFEFTVKGFDTFNTVAFAGVVADTIDIIFKDESGAQVASVTDYTPTNYRDKNRRLAKFPTTAIVYSINESTLASVDVPAMGTAIITLTGSYLEVGTIILGLSTNAGFTNVAFGNEFIDLSPSERDQWGYITYVDGVKYKIYTGTVDVPIREYDMTDKLMLSLGGGTVIVNGSGSVDNTPPDSHCIFDATMIVGRLSNVKLKTSMANKRIGDMASYSFIVKENI